MKKLFKILIIALVFSSSKANANCNFKVAKHIEDLSNPNIIKNIKISIPKSREYTLNFVRSIISRSNNIPSKLKKKFSADLVVNYDFGKCEYKAKIWQNGDFKDHLQFKNGMPWRSLNVKLNNGNILNAIKFKLLIPETRNGDNEILGTVILRKFGVITPETFEVLVNVNDVISPMIFQEDSQKEMLERNKKREGPIFEGDEYYMWSQDGGKNFELEDISLVRLINSNWFLKGQSSKKIVLNSYNELLESYLIYSHSWKELGNGYVLKIKDKNNKFQNFNFLMFTMYGFHALRPHNRKFYYNSFENSFEPIYYDGDLRFTSMIGADILDGMFTKEYSFPFHNLLKDKSFKENVLKDFKKRVINFDDKRYTFFKKSMRNIELNSSYLQSLIDKIENKDNIDNFIDYRESYLDSLRRKKINQKVIDFVELRGNDVKIKFNDGRSDEILYEEFASILKRNELNGNRTIYLPLINKITKFDKKVEYIKYEDGLLIFTKGLNISLDKLNKKLVVNQTNNNEWILIKNLNLSDWDITFNGTRSTLNKSDQRFNEFGLTGCLNIYNSDLNKSSIKVYDAPCEDSLNLVNAKGFIESVEIYNAYQDGLDIDFSDVNINNVKINSSGNDCLDLSYGSYFIKKASLQKCNDKGISIGEKSKLNLNKAIIEYSNIGISVKDSSILKAYYADIRNVNICIEAKNKKQEFEGGLANIEEIKCPNLFTEDTKSIINIKSRK